MVETSEKTVVLAAMPPASRAIAAKANPGRRTSWRNAIGQWVTPTDLHARNRDSKRPLNHLRFVVVR